MLNYEVWLELLVILGSEYGVQITDSPEWRDDYDKGVTPDQAFDEAYPEYRAQGE